MSYLLAMDPNINDQDIDGNTALHLAVKYVEDAETTRMVRFLMLRGADTTIKNKDGKLAIDFRSEIETKSWKNDVERLLGPPGTFDFLMLSTPTRKIKRRPILLGVFVSLFLMV
jgi:ankyrin repeat protein